MVELVRIRAAEDRMLDLVFSDGSTGRWSAESAILRDTILTRPLQDPAYFRKAFIDAGSLAWPNGLEFSAHRSAREAGSGGLAGPQGSLIILVRLG